jgi:hypothetical protein
MEMEMGLRNKDNKRSLLNKYFWFNIGKVNPKIYIFKNKNFKRYSFYLYSVEMAV